MIAWYLAARLRMTFFILRELLRLCNRNSCLPLTVATTRRRMEVRQIPPTKGNTKQYNGMARYGVASLWPTAAGR